MNLLYYLLVMNVLVIFAYFVGFFWGSHLEQKKCDKALDEQAEAIHELG